MHKKALVLVSPNRLSVVMQCLKEAGYRLTVVEDIEEGRIILAVSEYDLALFEFHPELDFIACIEDIRSRTAAFVFALVDSEDYGTVEPYLHLADEAMLTHFNPKELTVRARVLAKQPVAPWRKRAKDEQILEFGELRIFPGRHAVMCNRRPVKLTPTEYAILMLLVYHPGQVFSQGQIYDVIRNDYADINVGKTISNHISGLRKALAKLSQQEYIHVERSVGYYFDVD